MLITGHGVYLRKYMLIHSINGCGVEDFVSRGHVIQRRLTDPGVMELLKLLLAVLQVLNKRVLDKK